MTATYAAALPARPHNGDRAVSHAVYGLYVFSPLLLGLPALVGLAIAYGRQAEAADAERAHFTRQIEIAWSGLAWLVAAVIWGVAAAVGGVGDVLDGGEFEWGAPLFLFGMSVFAMLAGPVHFWVSSLKGWTRLASGRASRHSRGR